VLAVDIGTTTIAASLLDRISGRRLGRAGAMNPQREFGADVVLRLQAACESESDLRKMSELVNSEIERIAAELAGSSGVGTADIEAVAIAGNPTMEHLLLGIPVFSLAFPPHRPSFTSLRTVRTASLGWSSDLETALFPLPGGFVGGDLVAFVYGCLPENARLEPTLFIDLGTNAEIAVAAGDRFLATSAAAGPALEGGNLCCGMPAFPGAIKGVEVVGDKLRCRTVGSGTPAGICGSGVIEMVALMIEYGLVDSTGRIVDRAETASNLGNRIGEVGGEAAFVLYRDASGLVYISQHDIRAVQLAKSALRAGIEITLDRAGVTVDDLERVVVTGSFGAELSPSALKSIGIITEKMVNISSFVREGALAGVEKALVAPEGFSEVEALAEKTRVIPLSGTPAFERLFFEHMNFPDAKE
jgi:uncharacterized 2Fe-2S/4Fe-4S cluster protein (DUF4445 family)